MQIQTFSGPLFKARSVNETTATTYRALVPTLTKPKDLASATLGSAYEIAAPKHGGSLMPTVVKALLYGDSGDDKVCNARFVGWTLLPGVQQSSADLWVPITLAEVIFTLGSTPGATGGRILATEFFADTITLVAGNNNVSIDITSPADNTIGHVMVALKGCPMIEVQFANTDAGGYNALLSLH